MSRAGSRRADAAPTAPVGPARARRALVAAVAGIVVFAGALALAGTAKPVPVPDRPTQRVTTPAQREVVCPSSSIRSTTYVGLLPGLGGGAVSIDGSPFDLPAGGSREVTDPAKDPVTVVTTGVASRGIFADRVQGRGGIARCTSPRASWWFTGAGATDAHDSTLLLTNPRSGPAVVDIQVYANDGPVDGAGLRGISVSSGKQVILRLADVAPAKGNLAVHVQVTRGLVSAAVEDRAVDVLTPGAAVTHEFLPDQGRPQRHVVVTGLPGPRAVATTPTLPKTPAVLTDGAGLVLANPGDTAAVVRVRLSGAEGLVLPTRLGQQSVAAGATKTVQIPARSLRRGMSVVVDSDQPVSAGYLVAGTTDLVHGVVGAPWSGPAAAALPPTSQRTLMLTADQAPAAGSTSVTGAGSGEKGEPVTVTVTELSASGASLDEAEVTVQPRTTVTRMLAPGAASVVVTSPGGVVGAVLVERKGAFSAVPLSAVLSALRVPQVRPLG